ncbi:LacI family DNA-binding transcriptional regulator [Undibacterium arcticum]|uniref:LacI family DNA-binding transcriptional regulator n=1 Tax=Undibacterium arcticum TaxID=1762892 RepID=UPI003618CF60
MQDYLISRFCQVFWQRCQKFFWPASMQSNAHIQLPYEKYNHNKKKPGRITIREVAAHASVNSSTVSRVLNPATRYLIGDEVALRVLASAKTLGYRQNTVASALRGGKSKVIGVLLPDIENPVFPPMVRGIEAQLAAEGFSVLIANAVGTPKDQERVLEQMFRVKWMA